MNNRCNTLSVRFLLLVFLGFFLAELEAQSVVSYAGGLTAERFQTIYALSDGTLLVGGTTKELDWLPTTLTPIVVEDTSIHNQNTKNAKYAFILHISEDLQTILNVLHFPKGAVEDIRHIKSNSLSGETTGDIYISGEVKGSASKRGGYFIGKLNGNFLSDVPTDLSWSRQIYATGSHQTEQPWDVGGDGKVVYITGEPYSTGWCAVLRLTADGAGEDVVPFWRTHKGLNILDGVEEQGHWTPADANLDVIPQSSMVVLRVTNRCDWRSWTQSDYSAVLPDGNGHTKQGRWPLDLFFDKACNPDEPGTTMTSPGYTGYQNGANPSLRVGGVAVDRRTNDIYIGANIQSALPAGIPDFEPMVVAYTSSGKLKWWSRLYRETPSNSPPDQYVDGLTIDYSKSPTSGTLVVLGRQHGNNTFSMWSDPNGKAFQQSFTGTNGDIHISWLGKLKLKDGTLEASTYLAGYQESDLLGQAPYTEGIHDGWPSHNAGWPNLNTTRAEIDLKVDAMGNIYVLPTARRFVTTSNAYQKQVRPPLASSWADHIRVYEPDFSKLIYSSALTGVWDTSTGAGGGNTDLMGVVPVHNGVILVGFHKDNEEDGTADGNPVAVSNVLPWGNATPQGESALIARLNFSDQVKAYFTTSPVGGNCVGSLTEIRDTSYLATSWQWDFGTDASPATANTKGPHQVSWATPGTKNIQLIVSDGINQDTLIQTYDVSPTVNAGISFTGDASAAPTTLNFSTPTDPTYTYFWQITDAEGTHTYSEATPAHEFSTAGLVPIALTVSTGACEISLVDTINIVGGPGIPDAEFSWDQSAICVGTPVIFRQTDSTNTVNWTWFFGEGAAPLKANTKGPHSVSYQTPGRKTVTLIVSNGSIQRFIQKRFEVFEGPDAEFPDLGPLTYVAPPTGSAATFVLNAPVPGTTYEWNFGDPFGDKDNTSTQASPTHFYYWRGTFYPRVTVTDARGCSDTHVGKVEVEPDCSRRFRLAISPTNQICVGNKAIVADMNLDLSTSELRWNFGEDASPATANGVNPPTISWSSPGQKSIVVARPNNDRNACVDSKLYTVLPYPEADFSFGGDACTTPATLTFYPKRASGYVYSWDFGDPSGTGNTSNSSQPTHAFGTAGKYAVGLTVNRGGCETHMVKQVVIGAGCEEELIAGIMAQPSAQGCQVPEVIFSNLSTGSVDALDWNFGAGATPATANTAGPHTVSYDTPGPHIVTLTLTRGVDTETVTLTLP